MMTLYDDDDVNHHRHHQVSSYIHLHTQIQESSYLVIHLIGVAVLSYRNTASSGCYSQTETFTPYIGLHVNLHVGGVQHGEYYQLDAGDSNLV